MNRLKKRVWIMVVFILILIVGMALFLGEYAVKADSWVSFPGSPHLYNKGNIGTGLITDREGTPLLDTREGRIYSDDPMLRKATLHWVGDRNGSIRASAVSSYVLQMSGFDKINGIYASGGDSVMTLTLSAPIQKAALEALGNRKGTIGVYNYRTGEILCAVTGPTFDPDAPPKINIEDEAYEGIYLNRFIQSTYVPGSIFKIVTTAAALDTVPDILDRTFTCTGKLEYGIDRVTCERAHGTLTLKEAFARSCNCSFAQIAQLVGDEGMMDHVRQFRITEPLQFDGVTTAAGHFDVADAAKVELAWGSIGQYTDQINPARYMAFMGAIASGGTGASPYLVSRVEAGEKTTYQAETKEMSRIMDPALADTLKSYMRNNVQMIYGDQHFPGLSVCAKSGTSELGGEKKPNSMFAGFVADEQYPLAFIAVVENGGYGAQTCVPVISKVLSAAKAVLDAQ